MCFDGVKRLCHIRGKLRKKVWINQSGGHVLRRCQASLSHQRQAKEEGLDKSVWRPCASTVSSVSVTSEAS